MLGWKVLGSGLCNVQYEIHLENTINPMQGWQKQKLNSTNSPTFLALDLIYNTIHYVLKITVNVTNCSKTV